ncbi:hypothetical protein [Bacillus toyonensis]|uniref:hypothetical protein n=1 Tax=Bacillus toyonensis TaxID=155322 RepID=UPI0011459399|nr:hypothetical protein [Bacillus toyonensis]
MRNYEGENAGAELDKLPEKILIRWIYWDYNSSPNKPLGVNHTHCMVFSREMENYFISYEELRREIAVRKIKEDCA